MLRANTPRENHRFEGWGAPYDYDCEEHMEQCSYVMTPYTSDVTVVTVSRYEDTGADARSREVLEISGVDCKCGALTNRSIYWEASMKTIVEAMTTM